MDIQYSVMASQLWTPSPSDNGGSEGTNKVSYVILPKYTHESRFFKVYSWKCTFGMELGISLSSTALKDDYLFQAHPFRFFWAMRIEKRWWLNKNQLTGKFKLFIFLFRFNRTHHNIFPDDFTVDQLTILPEDIEKINWVLGSSLKKTYLSTMGTMMLILSFKRKYHWRLLYYVCINIKIFQH